MYSDRRGTDKNHPGQNLPVKNPRTKPPVKNLRELRQTPCKDIILCMYACTTKNRGVPRCVTKREREEGVKIGPKYRDVHYERPVPKLVCLCESSLYKIILVGNVHIVL